MVGFLTTSDLVWPGRLEGVRLLTQKREPKTVMRRSYGVMSRHSGVAIRQAPARTRSKEPLSLRASMAVIFGTSLGLWFLIGAALYALFD